MSEGVPKRKVGDEVQVMNTSEMQDLGIANKKGKVRVASKDDSYLIKISGIAGLYNINGHSLRAWVEPLKGDLNGD